MRDRRHFRDVVREAIADFARYGFDSDMRLQDWLKRIERAAALSMTPPAVMRDELQRTLMNTYARVVERGTVLSAHPGVSKFTLNRVKPKLRMELDRRIAASTSLIKLHREDAVATTLRRFSGWATSVPPGGSKVVEKAEEAETVRKSIGQLDFIARRVAIDQGHKLVATVNDILAKDAGAIAAIWHSHWREPGYNYREDHKELDGNVFLIPDNWALEKGLVKPGKAGFTTGVPMPAEEPFCRCYYQYIYLLRRIPADMLTARGRLALEHKAA